jgi:anti-sigma factor RsiW
MTQCPTDDQLLAILFDDTAQAERRTWEAHLADCAACRERIADFDRTESLVSIVYRSTPTRPEWLDEMKSMIAGDLTPQNLQRTSPVTVRSFPARVLVAAGGCLATAAIILVLVSASLQNSKTNTSTQPSNAIVQSPIADSSSTDPTASLPESHTDVVKPVGEYLVARDPQSDDSFELYWVLPVQN